ncbi:MAG: hypothetical protein Ct9H300mP7_1310 [Verrucomicrobiota bacterium]|nr:MAG: hypothetical protein Ct9H300mP7_1310 [Verrucomicrobiota bacterium]
MHGPGYSKILLGDDVVDQWEDHLDLMADSIYKNSGRAALTVPASGHRAIRRKLPRRLLNVLAGTR